MVEEKVYEYKFRRKDGTYGVRRCVKKIKTNQTRTRLPERALLISHIKTLSEDQCKNILTSLTEVAEA